MIDQRDSTDSDREYREILEEYKPLLKTIVSDYYAPGSSREDLMQEARIALIRAHENYDPDKEIPFSAFGALCVRRQLQDFVRAQRRKKHEVLNQAGSLESRGHRPATQDVDPETELLAKEALEFLRNVAENCLTRLERKALSGYLGGESYSSVARRLGEDEKAVDNALTRARRKIAREIDPSQLSLEAVLFQQD